MTTKLIVSFISFFLSIFFVEHYSLTAVITSNFVILTTREHRPLNSIFASQFNCTTLVKFRVFVLRVATRGPHLVFSWTLINTRAELPKSKVPRVPRSNSKTFFLVFTYIWQKDIAKIPKAPGAPSHNIIRRNHLLYHFSIAVIHLHLTSFYATFYTFKK